MMRSAYGIFQRGIVYIGIIILCLSNISYVTATDSDASIVLRGHSHTSNTIQHRFLQEDVDVVGLFVEMVIEYAPDDNIPESIASGIDSESPFDRRSLRKLPGKSAQAHANRPHRVYTVEFPDGTIHEIKNGAPEWVANMKSGKDRIKFEGVTINEDGSIDAKGKAPIHAASHSKGQGNNKKKIGVPFGRTLQDEGESTIRTPVQNSNLSKLRRKLQVGSRTVLAVKVVADNGAAYSYTAAQLEDFVFRPSTSGSAENNDGGFPSKYAECSYDQTSIRFHARHYNG